MALTEKTIVDKIEVLENNSIQVRAANVTNFYPLYPPVQKKSNIATFTVY